MFNKIADGATGHAYKSNASVQGNFLDLIDKNLKLTKEIEVKGGVSITLPPHTQRGSLYQGSLYSEI